MTDAVGTMCLACSGDNAAGTTVRVSAGAAGLVYNGHGPTRLRTRRR